MAPAPSVAVLGAGILGSSVALFLARRGALVTLFDAKDRPFEGASRWNEGKIHLGYIYAADQTGSTARQLLPGALAFRSLAERLIGRSLQSATTPEDDTFLLHRQPVVGAEETEIYFDRISTMARDHPGAGDYLRDLTVAHVERLSRSELEAICDPSAIVAGYRIPERSVDAHWVAEQFISAIGAETKIELAAGRTVVAVRALEKRQEGQFQVDTDDGHFGPFDNVVNALWEGRLAIDQTLGISPPSEWPHRYRLSLFTRTRSEVDALNVVIGVGPYGDIKNYNRRDLYLSPVPDRTPRRKQRDPTNSARRPCRARKTHFG